MKLLLDSQISAQVAAWLRKTGHDVREVRTDPTLHGAPDETLVQTAWREGRVLVSASPAFARLISREGGWRPGAILLLAGDPRPRTQRQTLQTLLEQLSEAKLMTSLVIVEGHRARVYPLVAHPPEKATPELQPRSREPLLSPSSASSVHSYLTCPVCGYTMKPLHGCKQVCPACGYLSSCSMD
jgi:predicted nuclease of predicted toxin-antitoxin system